MFRFIWHNDWYLVVMELSSIQDKVCQVFYSYLLYVFHEFYYGFV